MPFSPDRTRETTSTVGLVPYVLNGAVAGCLPFSSSFPSLGMTAYCVTDGTNFEIVYGAVTPGAPYTLARNIVLASSNAGAPVNWGAGSKNVFSTFPAAMSWQPIGSNSINGDMQRISGDTSPFYIGTWHQPAAQFTGRIDNGTPGIAGTLLTVSAMNVGSGPLAVGDALVIAQGGVLFNTTILSFGTGAGGIGTYNVSQSQSIASTNLATVHGALGVLLCDTVMYYWAHNAPLDSNPASGTYGSHLGRSDAGTCTLWAFTEGGRIVIFNAVTAAAGAVPVWTQTYSFDTNTGLETISGLATSIRTITAATDTVGVTDSSLIFNYAGTVTETLPSPALYKGRILRLRTITANTVVSASANVVPLAGGAAGTAILAATAGKWCDLQSDGTNYQIMAGN